jgi:hypothetical protein
MLHYLQTARSHLSAFFAKYPGFKYDPSQPFMDEFWRLAGANGYGRRGKRYKLARRGLKDAIIQEFRDIYSAHSCDHSVWLKFFEAIGVDERPQNIGLCHRV